MHAVADTDGAAAATQPPQTSEKETQIRREDGEGKRCCEVITVKINTIHPAVPLTPGDMREIIDMTWPHRASWKLIGIDLGIDIGTLDAIEKDRRVVQDCLSELISTWLRKADPRPTRAAITAVLKSKHIINAEGS